VRDGDVLAVTKPDRLARSTAELLSIEANRPREIVVSNTWGKPGAAPRAGSHLQAAGRIFWFMRKKLSGSYFALI
jgi:hypothetical protein